MKSCMKRRDFLKASAKTGAMIAMPAIVPASALGLGSKIAPNSRIVMGIIGAGNRGSHDLAAALAENDTQFVAVCDVQKSRRERAKKTIDDHNGNSDCAMYSDFRDLLARPDIDAIIQAPGDRWHTPMAVMAMKAGKDVYSEKPGTMCIAEGRTLVETAKRCARVFQTGTQRRSEANFVFADELARGGYLGKIHTVRAHTLPFEMRTDWLPAQPEPARDDVDWNLWLGPAPFRPFNKAYLNGCGAWLNFFDFGSGVAGWTSHTICQCQGAIGCDLTSPVEYESCANKTADGFTARYENGIKLVLGAGNFGNFGIWHGSCGVRYEGSEGWVSMADGYSAPDLSRPSLLGERSRLVENYCERHRRPMNHMRDFLDCVHSRRQTVAHPEIAHRSMSTSHAINISMLLGRSLKFDPAKERFVGDAEANRFLMRAMREPWTA